MLDFLIPFLTVTLAELGDKTQLSILLLSSKTKKHLHLLAGVALAYLLVDGVAVLAGAWITTVIPTDGLKIAAGSVFVLFGILTLKNSESEKEEIKKHLINPFLSGFVLISLAEWGDKTQIAAALLSTKYNPWLVLAGTLIALTFLSALAIYLGKFMAKKFGGRVLSKISGAAFILVGVSFFIIK